MGWVIAAAVGAALLASPWFGADSRDGADWKPLVPARSARRAVRPFSESPGVAGVRAGIGRLTRTVRRRSRVQAVQTVRPTTVSPSCR